MASVALGTKAIGSTVKLKESGTPVEYLVVHHGRPSNIYDVSCDGTWLLRKDIYETRQWHSSNSNDWANSTLKAYLDSTFLGRFESNIQAAIKQVKIPYCAGSGTSGTISSGGSGLSCKVFLLSATEVGYTKANVNQYIPDGEGAKLSHFQSGNGTSEKIAYLNGSATYWWLRSPNLYGALDAWLVYSNGDANYDYCSNTCGVRPALCLSSDLLVSDDGSVTTNTAPTTPSSINVPETVHGGSAITVSWGASTDAESNLEGYVLERSVDGGSSWAQVYQGNATSTTNTVPFGSPNVTFRVRAYDTQGLYSGYRTSQQRTVINNTAPGAPASITIPTEVLGGSNVTLTWGAASDVDGNLEGYAVERQVDSGAWAEIWRGNALSYTDAVTKGWASVAYRVRAYDTYTAYSGYVTSPTRTVNNNTPPEITCDSPSGTNLGTKTGGFAVGYSVDDADGDTVTVTEETDGVAKRTFTATLGQDNSFQVTGEYFMKLLNGQHSLKIAATDGKAITEHTLTFTKTVTGASVTLAQPMEADGQIEICVLSVIGSIPTDAAFHVEVTNNAKDPTPTWEDCTNEVRNGANFVFTNHSAANGYAFNFRVTVERGESGTGGYIVSVQGGFQ